MRVDLMAVASDGGHLTELLELCDAWKGRQCHYVCTSPARPAQIADSGYETIIDCHRGQWLRIAACAMEALWIVVRRRPRCIVSTGALPGLLVIVSGWLVGARLVWIDSLANADEISASGRMARRVADHFIVQWPQIAEASGALYGGSIL